MLLRERPMVKSNAKGSSIEASASQIAHMAYCAGAVNPRALHQMKLMKNQLIALALLFSLAFAACEKETVVPEPNQPNNPSNPTNPTNPGANKWTINGITYTHITNSAVWNGGGSTWGLMGNGSADSLVAFQLWFKTQTPRTGNYNIIPFLSLFSSTDSMAVAISVSLGTRVWNSIPNSGTIAVTNDAGVISCTATNATIKRTTSDSTTVIAGNLTYRP